MKVEVSCYQHLYRAELQNLTLNAPQWSCSSVCWFSALCCHLVVEHQPLSGRSPEQVTGQWRHHDSGFIMLISVNETQLRVHVHRQNNMEVSWCYSEVLQQLTDADFLSQPVGVITSCPAARWRLFWETQMFNFTKCFQSPDWMRYSKPKTLD